jgi:hypothetical protein
MLADGVTGNTSDFGSEESRFEPWSANQRKSPAARTGLFVFRAFGSLPYQAHHLHAGAYFVKATTATGVEVVRLVRE